MPYPIEDSLTDDAIHRIVDSVIRDLPDELADHIRREKLHAMRESLRAAIRKAEIDHHWRELRGERRHWIDRRFEQLLEDIEDRLSVAQTKNSRHLEQTMREQLADLQEAMRGSAVSCRFQSESAVGDYTQLITGVPVSPGGSLRADAPGFLTALRKVATGGSVLVLVDPYALAETDDSGKVRLVAKEVHDLVKGLSLDKFIIYCRNDAIHKPCLDALVKELKNKLEVRCGDFHDRYLLVGRDGSSKSFVEFDEPWHGVTNWTGVAFGASLNGVSKRPTYVLRFEAQDLPVVKKYLKDAAPSKRAL